MKFTIERAELVRMLSAIEKIVESRNTIPILSNVLIVATDTTLMLRATDLDIEATISAPLICEPGSVTVPIKKLSEIAKKTGHKDISVELDDNQLIVKSGRSRVKLMVLSADDFPVMPTQTYEAELDADLSQLANSTQFAISTEETRYYLNGMYLVGNGEQIEAVATTGHILSKTTLESDTEFQGIIIPRKTVGLLPKGMVKLRISRNKIEIVKDDLTIVSKLIDGTFPDYNRIIPKRNDIKIKIDNSMLSQSVKFVSTVCSEKGSAVSLDIASGAINVSAKHDADEAVDELSAVFSGEPIRIGLNSKYLADTLATLPAGEVEICIADAGSPVLFLSEAAPEQLTLIMPMRV